MKIVLAHRGVTYNYKENTLKSIFEIFKYNSKKYNIGVEIDINISKDNKIFIYHDEELNDIISANKSNFIVYDFYAKWCNPCMSIENDFNNLSNLYSDVLFIKIDSDLLEDFKDNMNVEKMPTFIICNSNNKECERILGASNIDKIKDYLNKNIKFELTEDF